MQWLLPLLPPPFDVQDDIARYRCIPSKDCSTEVCPSGDQPKIQLLNSRNHLVERLLIRKQKMSLGVVVQRHWILHLSHYLCYKMSSTIVSRHWWNELLSVCLTRQNLWPGSFYTVLRLKLLKTDLSCLTCSGCHERSLTWRLSFTPLPTPSFGNTSDRIE